MTVYQAVSPSGKSYIGITRKTPERRWYEHVRQARIDPTPHPLRSAIRKYGGAAFRLDTLLTGLTVEAAKAAEIGLIDLYQTQERRFGYNVSRGGDYDCVAATIAAWRNINATPETRAAYVRKLREAKLSADWSDYPAMVAAGRLWRDANPTLASAADARGICRMRAWASANPEQARRQSTAALRSARQSAADNPEQFRARLSAGIRLSFKDAGRLERHRSMVARVWAARSDVERRRVAALISASRIARNAALSPDEKAAAGAQLAAARKNIDHTKRKKNQKAALAAYWTPERRAEFSAKRKGVKHGPRKAKSI